MPSLDKIAFVLSVAFLSFLYGFATSARRWFPNDLLASAWHEATSLLQPPPPGWASPRVYDRSGVSILSPEEYQEGLTLISSVWRNGEEWTPGLKLIGREGREEHTWWVDPAALFPGAAEWVPGGLGELYVHGSYLFPDGDVLVNLEYVGTARLDPCGRTVWALPEGNHHSIARADDGTFWIPAVNRLGPEDDPNLSPAASPSYPRGYPGLDDPVIQDVLMRVSADGEVLDRITVLDVLYDHDLERLLVKTGGRRTGDVTHVNDIEPLSAAMADEYPLFEAGDLLVSLRNIDLVFVLDPEGRRVKWYAFAPFLRQHDPDFIGDGWIGVFDNNWDFTERGTMLGGSRIIALRPHDASERALLRSSRLDRFYTSLMGKWQRLPNGNLLLAEARAGRLLEVTSDGRMVWEWVAEPYSETRAPDVLEGTRYAIAPEQVASWECSPSGPGAP